MNADFDCEGPKNRSEELRYRDRAQRLFRFLREMSELKSNTARTIDLYDDFVWLNDIPDNEICFNIAKRPAPSAEKWIEIIKPILKPAPHVPEIIKPWIQFADVHVNLIC